jgi:hypothetical protein
MNNLEGAEIVVISGGRCECICLDQNPTGTYPSSVKEVNVGWCNDRKQCESVCSKRGLLMGHCN